MLSVIVGIAIGFAGGYLYGSDRARTEAQRRFAAMPEPVRRTTERISDAIDKAPVPDAVKQAAVRATAAVQSGTERAAQAVAPPSTVARPSAADISGRPSEPFPSSAAETPRT
jgi:hypothetical protein